MPLLYRKDLEGRKHPSIFVWTTLVVVFLLSTLLVTTTQQEIKGSSIDLKLEAPSQVYVTTVKGFKTLIINQFLPRVNFPTVCPPSCHQ